MRKASPTCGRFSEPGTIMDTSIPSARQMLYHFLLSCLSCNPENHSSDGLFWSSAFPADNSEAGIEFGGCLQDPARPQLYCD